MDPGAAGVAGVDLERVIGRGASSVVYLGIQQRFGRNVAVKVLDLPGRSELVSTLFLNECRTLGLLTHPNIVTVFDAGFDDAERPYLVMEYLPSGTVARQLAESGPLSVQQVLQLGVELAGALHTAHLHGIVHGDVKPQNVLRTRSGGAALGDFGIARFTTSSSATTRAPLFTPLHAAPELFEGQAATPRTDVYELCSTLFELLDGRPPVGDDSESPLIIVGRMVRGERRSLDRDRFPVDLVQVIESGLARDPAERPATAAALGERLQAVQRGLGEEATRLVVIDQLPAERSDAPVTGASVTTEAVPAGVASSMDGPSARTLPPPSAAWRPAVAVGSLVCAGLLLGGVAWWSIAGSGSATARRATVAGTQDERTTTSFVGSPYGGVQPDVTYDVPGARDLSPVLAARLGDPNSLVLALGTGLTVVDAPTYPVERLPATLRWQSFNPAGTPECIGLMSRPLTVVGLWEKSAIWPEHQANIRVVRFLNERQASEAFSGLSLEQGVTAGGCRGFARDLPATDPDEVDVVHREPALDLPAGTRYNTWVGPPPPSMTESTSISSAIVQVGDQVALVAVSSGQDVLTPAQMSGLMTNIVTRLQA